MLVSYMPLAIIALELRGKKLSKISPYSKKSHSTLVHDNQRNFWRAIQKRCATSGELWQR